MRGKPRRLGRTPGALRAAILVFGLACLAPRCAPPAPDASPERAPSIVAEAVALYDAGRYEEALPLLERIDADGQAGGALLYRLGFCYGAAGDPGRQHALMERALARLTEEAAAGSDLETSFFLANAQSNLGRAAEASRTAAEATARVESGAWPAPGRALEQFRLAKLYADQGRAEAVRWYRSALEGFASEGAAAPGYVRWARRYLAQLAFARSDFEGAEVDYAALAEAGAATPADYDRLAVARVRLGRWGLAADAWREAEKLDPANADRARYCWRLGRMAEALGSLPAADPAGRPWSAVSKEDLEAILEEQAAAARAARQEAVEAAATASDPEGRRRLAERLAGARPMFVAAALEYAARDHDIRATSFVGGYAPLIFQADLWELPEP